MFSTVFQEDIVHGLEVLAKPLVLQEMENGKSVPRISEWMEGVTSLGTPISPLIMKLGFGIVEAKQLYPAVEALSEVSRMVHVSSVVPSEAVAYNVGLEAAIKSLITLLHAPIERYTMERIPLEAPRAVPSVKLHEIIPLLTSVRAPPSEKSPMINRVKSIERPRSIQVKVESLKDERDLRELRRRITRILREEARRYGVF
jgi:hypothetical protein